MSAWKTASLGEIFDIARGGSPRPIQDYLTDDPNGVNWISISDASASSKFITATKKRIRPEGVSRSRMVKPGDFLLTNSMSFGRPYIMGTTGCIHDGWLVLSSKREDVDQDYFFQLLSSDFIYAKFAKLAAGATVKNLNIDLVSGVEVTFPPLEEQRRIAAILDQAEALRTQRRTALALLNSLPQSLFIDMFGDLVANPEGGQIRELQQVVKQDAIVTYGIVQAGDEFTGGVPYIRTGDIVDGTIRLSGLRHTNPEIAAKFSRSRVQENEIVMSIRATVGTTALVPAELSGANLTQGTARIAPGADVNFQYLLYFLRSDGAQQWIERQVKGATFREITLGRLRELPVLVPSLSLQKIFATRIESIEALKATHRRALAALDTLFASLQQRGFASELLASQDATHPIPAHKTVESVEDLRTLEAALGLEALIYVAKRTAGNDLYTALKTLYMADKRHLEIHGHLIYGETYNALPMGPVPEAAYEAIKFLRDEQELLCEFGDSNVRAALKAEGTKRLIPLRDADLSKLGADIVQSLEAAIRYFANADFGQVKTATHDSAYERTPKNQAMSMQHIIEMLPAEARQRHWNL